MSTVLLDIYSILTLKSALEASEHQQHLRHFEGFPSIIQSLVLCDKVLLDGEGARGWKVVDVCNQFHDAFALIDSENINGTDISAELQGLRTTNDLMLGTYFNLARGRRDLLLARVDKYLALARKLGVYLSLHPDRAGKLRAVLGKASRCPTSEIAIAHLDERLAATSVAKYAGIDLLLPPVFEYVMTFMQANKIDLPTAVNEIRCSKNAIRFRNRCQKIDEELVDLSGRSSVHALQQLISEIDALASKWEKDLDEEVKYIRREISLRKVWGIGVILESIGLGTFTIKDPVISPNHADLLFLNDLYRKPRKRIRLR
jgi:hypothetical protein